MLKGSKEIHLNTISCNAMYVESVKRHSKYAVRAHNIFVHNFLNVQPIFNPKKFGKLRHRAFHPYHQMLCMSKHVETSEGSHCIIS